MDLSMAASSGEAVRHCFCTKFLASRFIIGVRAQSLDLRQNPRKETTNESKANLFPRPNMIGIMGLQYYCSSNAFKVKT